MIADEERREVARRLRDCPAELVAAATSTDNACKYYILDLLECVGLGAQNVTSLFERLADLIEPVDRNDELCAHCDYCDYCDLPECSEQDGYSFKPKGYVDLLVLADKTIRGARHDMEIYGDTVPAWYAAGRLEAVARSIREILGVES